MRIELRYTCTQCFLVDVKLEVEGRIPGLGISDWMDAMIQEIARDHRKRSPNCLADKITNVKIPIYDDRAIGESQKQ